MSDLARELRDNYPAVDVTTARFVDFAGVACCVIPQERVLAVISALDSHADLVRALEEILSAEKEFREGMPAGWEGDPLTDACAAARAALATLTARKVG